tara:strand:+ start:521 stop:979 length:459 start_codon:yes stop_codon:yes gene_type:complete
MKIYNLPRDSKETIEFTIYGPPVALKRHRHLRSGHTYDPSKKDKANFLAKSKNLAPKSPLDGPIFMYIEFHIARPKSHYRTGKYKHLLKQGVLFHCPKRPDIDNYAKLVLDALNGVFYKDDGQVTTLVITKVYSTKPKTVIRIEGENEITIS